MKNLLQTIARYAVLVAGGVFFCIVLMWFLNLPVDTATLQDTTQKAATAYYFAGIAALVVFWEPWRWYLLGTLLLVSIIQGSDGFDGEHVGLQVLLASAIVFVVGFIFRWDTQPHRVEKRRQRLQARRTTSTEAEPTTPDAST